MFFVTPRLAGCNIFVAHDPSIHKFWVLRISSKNPYLPPDLEQQRAAEARQAEEQEREKQAREEEARKVRRLIYHEL